MALIRCSECGKEISDQALSCPNCGKPQTQIPRPIRSPDTVSASPKKGSGKGWLVALIVVVCLTLLCIGPCLGPSCSPPSRPAVTPSTPSNQYSPPAQTTSSSQVASTSSAPRTPQIGENSQNPVPFGQWVTDTRTFGSQVFRIRVVESYSGADALDRLRQENPFTLPPDDNNMFYVVRVEVDYPDNGTNEGSLDLIVYNSKVYSQGQLFDNRINLIIEPTLSSIQLLPGGQTSGWLWFEIPETCPNPLLLLGANLFTDEGGIYMQMIPVNSESSAGQIDDTVNTTPANTTISRGNSSFDAVNTIRPGMVSSVGSEARSRLLVDSDLDQLSYREIKLVRNYLFAVYDRPFAVQWISEYFLAHMSGYEGNGPSDPTLTGIESANMTFIQEYEQEHNIPVMN